MSGKKLINRPEDAVDEALEGKHITVTVCHCQQMDCLARFAICVGLDGGCEDICRTTRIWTKELIDSNP
jgi:hypothetical protein